jgi:putative ABC transport system permease protein
MFKNYLIIALRNFKRNKLHTFINVLGLSVAFASNIILISIAFHEFSFDSFHENKDKIFRVYTMSRSSSGVNEKHTSLGYPHSLMLKDEIPAIEFVSPYMEGGSRIAYNNNDYEFDIRFVRNDFFSMFSFPIVSGNKVNPLKDLQSIVISKKVKQSIFKEDEAVGKQLKARIGGEWKQFTVSAVMDDIQKNSTLNGEVFMALENYPDFVEFRNKWNMGNHAIFVQLKKGFTIDQAEAQIKSVYLKYMAPEIANAKQMGLRPMENGDYIAMKLFPLSDIHFSSEFVYDSAVSKSYLWTLIAISFIIMAIACFNFVNLNIARIFTRYREVGVRKYLGAAKRQITVQLWGESLTLCLMALFVGIVIAYVVSPHILNGRIKPELFFQPATILLIIAGVFLVSLISGGYPAVLMSRLNIVNVLKGQPSLKKPGFFRNTLIVFQFTTACLLICCTMVIYKQFQFMRTAPLGFAKESVVSIPLFDIPNSRRIINDMRNRLANQPSIKSVSGSAINIGLGKDGSRSTWQVSFNHKGKEIGSYIFETDYDFFKTLGVPILKGRDFSKENMSDTANNVIINESMARLFPEKDLVGMSYRPNEDNGPAKTIIGIVPDFHVYSLHEESSPVAFYLSKQSLSYVFIKTESDNPKKVMDLIASVYKEVEPGKVFTGSFMDENVGRWYEKEKELSSIFAIGSGIAITLSCLGLFAMALLVVEQRTKEVGVRKVLGASVSSITYLLSKEFIRMVLVALLIAIPLAWYFMNQWLRDFPYQINLSWWQLLLGGLAAFAIALITVSFHSVRAALQTPVKSINIER